MNRKQKTRLTIILIVLALVSTAAGLILFALKQNINLFYTPSELLAAHIQPNQTLRIGGYVKNKSVQYSLDGKSVIFIVTDRTNEMVVNYHGVLPNLFREGQAVVVTGKLDSHQQFDANQVLAKHDEKYMPKSLVKSLNRGVKS